MVRLVSRGGLLPGLQSFAVAFRLLFTNRAVRAWFLRAALRAIGLAALTLFTLISLGAYGLWRYLGGDWVGAGAALLWVMLLIFVSGFFTVLFMNIFVPLLSGETALARAIEGLPFEEHKVTRGHRWRELRAFLLGVILTAVGWPLLVIPTVLPLGILIFAWAMGRGAAVTADRIFEEATGRSLLERRQELSPAHCLALGLLPAAASVVPVVGWAFLPLLQVAAYVSVRQALMDTAQN